MSKVDQDLLAFASGFDKKTKEWKKRKSVKHTEDEEVEEGEDVYLLKKNEQVGLADFAAVLGDELGFGGIKQTVAHLTPKNEAAGPSRLAEAVPLPGHQQQQVERKAAYALASREIGRWMPVIRQRRQAKHLVYGAPSEGKTPLTTSSLAEPSDLKKSSLEMEADELLRKAGLGTEDDGQVRNMEESLALQKLTPQELEKRYGELAKKRSLLFFQERKDRHAAKIKSKTYHRLLKRDRLKEEAEKEEEMGPEEREDARIKAEFERVKERMTLKTRKAGLWAATLIKRKKLDRSERDQLMQHVHDKDRLRQEIYGKAAELEESENEEDWNILDEEEEDEEHDGEKKETLFERLSKPTSKEEGEDDVDENSDEQEIDQIFGEETKKTFHEVVARRKYEPAGITQEDTEPKDKSKTKEKIARLGDLFAIEKDEENNTATVEQLELIKEAFAEDKVFANFSKQKEAEIQAEAPRDEDLTLPGWGVWSGHGLAPAPKGKIIRKAAPGSGIDPAKRKDAKMQHVIVHERRMKRAAHLMMPLDGKIPYPHQNKAAFEQAVNHPVGREWNSSRSFVKRIRPRVQVAAGHIVEPIQFVKQPKLQ